MISREGLREEIVNKKHLRGEVDEKQRYENETTSNKRIRDADNSTLFYKTVTAMTWRYRPYVSHTAPR